VTISPSPRAALVAFLAADTDVAGLAGPRVYGAELPGDETANMPRYAVVVQNAGGNGKANYSTQYNARFDVYAYGATPAEADLLQRACIGALEKLNRTVVSGTILYSAISLTGVYPGRTPVSFWPFAFTTWSIETNYQSVA
jgi:hypothetical protein